MGTPADGSRSNAPWLRFAFAAVAVLAGCAAQNEKPAHLAKPGDLLVRTSSGQEVRLVKPFRAGVPNGLYGGVIDVITTSTDGRERTERIDANAVCSVEGVPGWPDYDNVYGSIHNSEQTVAEDQERWQVLLHFDGRAEVRTDDGLESSPLEWAPRLRDNLCRKGDFDDRPTGGT